MKNANRTAGLVVACVWLLGTHGLRAQDWPQWRGPQRDNHVAGFNEPATWPKELKQKWQVTVGLGESSPLLVGDKIYVFGRQAGNEVTLCLDAASGKELWNDHYPAVAVKGPAGPYPGPRSTPAVAAGKICTLGVGGVVSCLDLASGKVVWRKETKAPQFYTSSSPLIVDGKCIVFSSALTAYDLFSGDAKWQWSGNGTPYGSPVLMTVEGTQQVVTPTVGALAGISVFDGKLLWQVKIGSGPKDYQSNFSTPVIADSTVIYSIASKAKGKDSGTGTVALAIKKMGGDFAATELWKASLAAHQYHAPVLKDSLLFGTSTGLKYFCLDVKSGTQLWLDTVERGKCGSILNAGSILLSLTSNKELVAMRPSNKEYSEVAKYNVAESWSIPIVAGKRIFVKDKAGALTLWTIE